MTMRRTYSYLNQIEHDQQLQARIDAVEIRVERTFNMPARRLLAFLGKQKRQSSQQPRPEESSGTWQL